MPLTKEDFIARTREKFPELEIDERMAELFQEFTDQDGGFRLEQAFLVKMFEAQAEGMGRDFKILHDKTQEAQFLAGIACIASCASLGLLLAFAMGFFG